MASGALRSPTLEEERERLVPMIKEFRKDVDALIQKVHSPTIANVGSIVPHNYNARKVSEEVERKLIEAKMWAGKMLEALGNPFPPELADKAN